MIPDIKFIEQFEELYSKIRTVGSEYLLDDINKSDIRITDRLSEDVFTSLFKMIVDGNGVIPNNKIKFVLYTYSQFLNEQYLSEISNLISNLKNETYKFWVVLIYWRKDPILKEYSKEKQINLISLVPENTGSFESIDWRLRIKNKKNNSIVYSKSFKSNCFNQKSCKYNFSRIFTTEFELQRELIYKYEDLFSRIRKIKKALSDNTNNYRIMNLNIAELFNK